MTISLAAVFLPLVFMSGLIGRIFREFSITIIVAIFASGIVSLTLTPLMCARLLAIAAPARKRTDRARSGRTRTTGSRCVRAFAMVLSALPLDFGADVADLPDRTGYLFYTIPKGFLPIGDSSFTRGVLVAQEGASPIRCTRTRPKPRL